MRRLLGVAAFVVVGAACSGGSAGSTTATSALAPSTTAGTTTSFTMAAATTTETAGPRLAGMSSGRGDDGSIEITLWLEGSHDSPGFVVGIDSDDSHADPSDPVAPHFEGSVDVDGDGGAEVISRGEVVAVSGAGFQEWAHFAVADQDTGTVLRVFLINDVAPRAGTVWAWVFGPGEQPGIAYGASFGGGCDVAGTDSPPGLGAACEEAEASGR